MLAVRRQMLATAQGAVASVTNVKIEISKNVTMTNVTTTNVTSVRFNSTKVATPTQHPHDQKSSYKPPTRGNPLNIATTLITDSQRKINDQEKFITHPLFPHPKFTQSECKSVKFEHRPPKSSEDKIAYNFMKLARKTFDFVTGYKKPVTLEEKLHGFKGTRYEMTEGKWLTRCIFLESVAGVPGMVAAFLRHLHSLRLLKRDKAWIETLLDEAYNERMHLLTFIKIGNPSWFTRIIIYIGQGVFCNLFFFAYLLNPRYCHRFVGYLEEEAVSTYLHLLQELQRGKLQKFDHVQIPDISWHYWRELDEHSSFEDLILRIRADEAKHREVNHTLANLNQRHDRNPFALEIEGVDREQPTNNLTSHKATGWEKDDLIL